MEWSLGGEQTKQEDVDFLVLVLRTGNRAARRFLEACEGDRDAAYKHLRYAQLPWQPELHGLFLRSFTPCAVAVLLLQQRLEGSRQCWLPKCDWLRGSFHSYRTGSCGGVCV